MEIRRAVEEELRLAGTGMEEDQRACASMREAHLGCGTWFRLLSGRALLTSVFQSACRGHSTLRSILLQRKQRA